MTLSTKSPGEIAKIVDKLPIVDTEINRISLVGCNLGQDMDKNNFLDRAFAKALLKEVKYSNNIETSVSARKALVSVTSDGRKETGEITPEGIKWFSKDRFQKVVFKFDKFGFVVTEQNPVLERIASFPDDSSGVLGKITDVDTVGNKDNIYLGEIERPSTSSQQWSLTSQPLRQMTSEDFSLYLDSMTRRTFKSAAEFIKEKFSVNKDTIIRLLSLNPVDGSVYQVEAVNIKKQKIQNNQNPWLTDYSYFDGKIMFKKIDGSRVEYNFKLHQDLIGGGLKLSLFKDVRLQIKGDTLPNEQDLLGKISDAFIGGDADTYLKRISVNNGNIKIDYENKQTQEVKTLTGKLTRDSKNPNICLIETKMGLDINVGANIERKYVATLDNLYDLQVHVRDVRVIQNRNAMIDEINTLGLFGVDVRRNTPEHFLYYQFGDVIYTCRTNFYIHWEGMIASHLRPLENVNTQISQNEYSRLRLKRWMWTDRYGRNEFPYGFDKTTYNDINFNLKKNYEYHLMRQYGRDTNSWVDFKSVHSSNDEISFEIRQGQTTQRVTMDFTQNQPLQLLKELLNGNHQNIRTKFTHILEGSLVLAVGLSEPVRNFNAHIINEFLIDLSLNPSFRMSYANMMDIHPMTRADSWGLVSETGFDAINKRTRPRNQRNQLSLRAESIVRPREMNVVRGYLLFSNRPMSGVNSYTFYTESGILTLDTQIRDRIIPIERSLLRTSFPDVVSPSFYRQASELSLPRSGPLGGSSEGELMQLVEFSENTGTKIEPLRLPISLSTDVINIATHVDQVLLEKNTQTGRKYEIVKHTLRYEENGFSFKIKCSDIPEVEETVSIHFEDSKLSSSELKDTVSDITESIQKEDVGSKSMTRVNKFLGVYGIVMGMRGAINDFENGKTFEGIVNLAQTAHGVVSLSETAQVYAAKVCSKFMTTEVQTLENSVVSLAKTEMSTALNEGKAVAGTAMDAAGAVGRSLTALGTVFGIYNTFQDLKRGTTIGYIDAGLDVAITITALLGPEAEVVAVALTIVRLVIDDFYYAIEKELASLPDNASALQKIGAVLTGLLKGFVLVLKDIADFLTLGLLSFIETANNIHEQHAKDREFLNKLSDYHEYFKVQKETGSTNKLINFAAGEESWNGGSVVFILNEDDTAEISMQIVDASGQKQDIRKHIQMEENTVDIVLGVGESHDVSFKKESAKILWFIPIDSEYLINKVTGKHDTLHGTYYGNSKDNKFFAIQSFPEGADLDYKLSDYFYELHGLDGNDVFYLGPQRSKVIGGNGRDTYIIPASGGKTVIDNYSADEDMDVLYLEVDFMNIVAEKHGNDLDLKYNDDHHVIIQNWFSNERARHMTFKANKGIVYNVTLGVHHQVHLIPLAIILAEETEGQNIDASTTIWKSVVMIIGSKYKDTLIGNGNNNHINGGKGINYMRGKGGSDTYIIDSSNGGERSFNTINNYDENCKIDKVIVDARFDDLIVDVTHNDILLRTKWTAQCYIHLTLENWFVDEKFRHMLFVTSDDIIFKIDNNRHNTRLIHAIIIDASREQAGQVIDASREMLNEVTTIIGSSFDDTIKGNNRNNYLDGGNGENTLVGGDGRDVYIIRKEYNRNMIDNFAEDQQDDLILLDYGYDEISVDFREPHVYVCVQSCSKYFVLLNWSLGKEHRHIQVRSNDGITFRIDSEGNTDKPSNIHKSPIEVNKSKAKKRQNILTNAQEYNSVQRIVGSNKTDFLVGNDLANIIEPGFGGAFMMGLNGNDKYVILDNYNGSNKIDNFAFDSLTDSVSLPYYFEEIQTKVKDSDVIVSSVHTNVSVILKGYVTDVKKRHMILKAEKDGVHFILPPETDFKPRAITLDKSLVDTNLAVDLSKNQTWESVIEG